MDTFLLRIFQHEVELQCKFIVTAALELKAALVTENTDEIWKQLQIILVASANLSKMFWGSSGRKDAERAPLRESLQVADDSPLRDPDLRNDFEHFDERLEEWFAKSEHRNYVGRMIGQPGGIVGIDPAERFQQFDPTTATVAFWDHAVSLNDVVAEAQRILPLARAEARKPRRGSHERRNDPTAVGCASSRQEAPARRSPPVRGWLSARRCSRERRSA
jgi:hypothetical protein